MLWMDLFFNFFIIFIFHFSLHSIELLILIWFYCQSRQSLQELQAAWPFCKRMPQCGNLSQLWSPWVRELDFMLIGFVTYFDTNVYCENARFLLNKIFTILLISGIAKSGLLFSILLWHENYGLVPYYHAIGWEYWILVALNQQFFGIHLIEQWPSLLMA